MVASLKKHLVCLRTRVCSIACICFRGRANTPAPVVRREFILVALVQAEKAPGQDKAHAQGQGQRPWRHLLVARVSAWHMATRLSLLGVTVLGNK